MPAPWPQIPGLRRRSPVGAGSSVGDVPRRYWVETLGCPKNQVDSDKLVGTLLTDGLEARRAPTRPT